MNVIKSLSFFIIFLYSKAFALSPLWGIQKITIDCGSIQIEESIHDQGPKINFPDDPGAQIEYCPLKPSVGYPELSLYTVSISSKNTDPAKYCMQKIFSTNKTVFSFKASIAQPGSFIVSGIMEHNKQRYDLNECLMIIEEIN